MNSKQLQRGTLSDKESEKMSINRFLQTVSKVSADKQPNYYKKRMSFAIPIQ